MNIYPFLALSSDACAGITIPKTTTPKPPNPKCKSAGDNICDDEANIAECKYDGGDCCGEGKEKWACTICKCLDPKFKGKWNSIQCKPFWEVIYLH